MEMSLEVSDIDISTSRDALGSLEGGCDAVASSADVDSSDELDAGI